MRNLFVYISCILIAPILALGQSSPLAITGTLVRPQEIVPNGTVLIQNGKILAAGAQVQLPQGASVVHTDGIIAPGLIDLHNHLTWNVFPRWKPIEEFGNRYDWEQKPVYNVLMDVPHTALVSEGLECEMERYAEVKAISEGETSVVGGMYASCDQGLARNLDYDAELGSGLGEIIYNVFPLTMSEYDVAQAVTALNAKPPGSLLIHIAEGSPHDASAAREFSEFEGRGLLKAWRFYHSRRSPHAAEFRDHGQGRRRPHLVAAQQYRTLWRHHQCWRSQSSAGAHGARSGLESDWK
jgi:5-methylthioadenosine/S-adenosylhomocysteine deaminase